MRVYLHAGAHRTGTSSFQACLSANRGALEAAGFDLAYPGRDGIADGRLALRLPHPRHARSPDDAWIAGVTGEIARHRKDGSRDLILSEENIPGRMYHFYKGEFFPAARRRAKLLAAALPGPVAHLVYVVRRYDQLFVSAYRKRAEDNAVPTFAEIRDRMAGMERGWPELITILRNRFRPERFSVVEYGARGTSAALLQRLLPEGAIAAPVEPERSLNLSATDRALKLLQARYRAGEALDRPAWQAVVAEHAGDRTDLGFAAFTPGQIAAMEKRYADDLGEIGGMDGVTLVR
ncbi:hypothetical protein ATO6_11090 [Oceanicola sp. 22II-s10i]|uniref:hypothetical protein n=1 Tax=Oceanicola sp. 22II-s10i TaxID=1317116 RepID=UPI000B52038E|nr:hypothetical protein [Oceanicola sp. 22II-s10i]OWU84851.1 hypothetical protein ATO6_11090 [Oceanicola sp. 22II-s10i]